MMGKELRILLLEDNATDAELIERELLKAKISFISRRVETAEDFVRGLRDFNPDIILSDYNLPSFDGLEALSIVKKGAFDVPFILVTGALGEERAVEILKSGATDYVLKDRLSRLSHVVLRAVREADEKAAKKHAEELLEQTRQQQLRLKDEFLSHVSHELRSPLTAIHQFVTILLDGLAGDLNSEQREYLDIALKNVYQLRTMISDLLEITRAETGKLTIEHQCIPIVRVVDETCTTLQKNAAVKGIALSADVSNNLPFAYADPVRIKQILVNLIDNGIKFTPENGTIVVRARTFDQDPNFLCISVTDNGCGISPGDAEKIFDRLYQTENTITGSRKGLGLGLYICRELVLRHGGKIWVESGIGEGSTFFFTLPVFSLPKLITPILTPQNLAKGSVALITIEVSSGNKTALTETGGDETALRKIAAVLSRCALPDMDVLLPRMIHGRSGNIFCLVASADQSGTEVLVRRIQSQLALGADLKNPALDYAVFSTLIGIPSLPFEHLIDHVVNKIEDILRAVAE